MNSFAKKHLLLAGLAITALACTACDRASTAKSALDGADGLNQCTLYVAEMNDRLKIL